MPICSLTKRSLLPSLTVLTNKQMKLIAYPHFNFAFVKFGYSEKATKFEKIFHLKFDTTQ